MNDPQPLRSEGADDFERILLESAEGDGLSKARHAKLLLSLGVTTATATAGAGAGAVTTATVAGATTKVGVTAALKWLGVAVLACAGTAVTVRVVRSSGASPVGPVAATTTISRLSTTSMSEERQSLGTVPLAPEASSSPAPPDLVPASPERPRGPSKSSGAESETRKSSPPAATPLTDEIAALDVARVALRSGQAKGALTALDAYDRRFARGVLRPEAAVMRIEARKALGDRAGTEKLARGFLAANPASPLAVRVRAMLGSSHQTSPSGD